MVLLRHPCAGPSSCPASHEQKCVGYNQALLGRMQQRLSTGTIARPARKVIPLLKGIMLQGNAAEDDPHVDARSLSSFQRRECS